MLVHALHRQCTTVSSKHQVSLEQLIVNKLLLHDTEGFCIAMVVWTTNQPCYRVNLIDENCVQPLNDCVADSLMQLPISFSSRQVSFYIGVAESAKRDVVR